MARYTGAKVRITRRLGALPGFTSKKIKVKTTTRSAWCHEKKANAIRITFGRKTKATI
jgi:hypothetical protein